MGSHATAEKNKQCRKCGKSPSHHPSQCPANDVTCRGCGKKGHYKRVCLSAKSVNEVQEDSEDESLFLGTVTTGKDPWTVNLTLKNKKVRFKIDTSADVTVIPDYVFNAVYTSNKPSPHKAPKPLLGPGGAPLDVLGATDILLRRGEKETVE